MSKRIKYIGLTVLLSFLFINIPFVTAYAQVGDMGFFGGISEGRRLPRTTEELIGDPWGGASRIELPYKELVFLSGRPSAELFEGIIVVDQKGAIDPEKPTGRYVLEIHVQPSPNSTSDIIINRFAAFTVTYRLEDRPGQQGSQAILNLDIIKNSWRETIETPSGTYELDRYLSSYLTSIIVDKTPGVDYYRGDVSGRLIYNKTIGDEEAGEDNETSIVLTAVQTGSFYGYSSVWSSTETHRMNVSLTSTNGDSNDLNNNWGMQYEVRPSVTVNKILQYTANEPTAISFEGNYKEVLQNFAGLKYDIFITPLFVWDEPKNGTVSIETINTFEQLPEPNLSFLKGNAAEDDIRKLFAMQILTGDPRYYVPTQAITRGQYMTALAKAIKLPLAPPANAGRNARNNNRRPAITSLFSDVDSTRPEFRYIQAIQKAGIAHGRDDGMFYFDYPIERQEAFTVLIRALGLTEMGLNPTVVTPFADSNDIADFAIREMGVALQLGLITPDLNGNIYPKRHITKGEAASLLNFFIEYMRNGLVSDYADQIVNIAR